MFHGYGGSHATYARTYKELIQNFRIFSIDLPGMAFSSKKDINLTNFDDTLDFFAETLISLVKQINNNQKIVLVGHSLGGFLAAHLVARYPSYFKQLLLLSPAGTSYLEDHEIKYL